MNTNIFKCMILKMHVFNKHFTVTRLKLTCARNHVLFRCRALLFKACNLLGFQNVYSRYYSNSKCLIIVLHYASILSQDYLDLTFILALMRGEIKWNQVWICEFSFRYQKVFRINYIRPLLDRSCGREIRSSCVREFYGNTITDKSEFNRVFLATWHFFAISCGWCF